MKSMLFLLSMLAFAPDALDTTDTITPDQVSKKAMKNVSERGKKFAHMTDAEAKEAFKKDLAELEMPISKLLRAETYNLNQMLVQGERLGIDKSKSLEILEDIYLGGAKQMREIIGKAFTGKDKSDFEDYISMQHAIVRKLMDTAAPTRSKLMLLNDYLKMEIKAVDQEIVNVIKKEYNKAINLSAMPAKK